ncbi:tight adherence pilus pseudopilin TadF [Tatumella terrea]
MNDMDVRQRIGAFVRNPQGSVVVEAAFIFVFLSVLTVAAMDYGFWIMARSKAERINYSLAAVIRERNTLYNGQETPGSSEVTELASLAKFLAQDSTASSLCVRLESVSFKDSATRQVDKYQKASAGKSRCEVNAPALTANLQLSPLSIRGRWIPLYQVSLSIPAPRGSLSALLRRTGALPETITVSNIVLAR